MNLILKHNFRLIFLLSLLIICSCSKSDENSVEGNDYCLVEIDGEFIETNLDVEPIFLDGGEDGFNQALAENINYPAEARENSVEGTVLVSYIITEQGTVNTIEIIEDPGTGLGETVSNALALITTGVSFSPGEIEGITVKVMKQVQVKFMLEG